VSWEAKHKLLMRYESTMSDYSTVINDLALRREGVRTGTWASLGPSLPNQSGSAARMDLERHVEEHGCQNLL
jgi:hypothetical protein